CKAGRDVQVYEASPHAGGRCRSFYDEGLDAVIDNGAHLMMSGNTDIMAYLDIIGATQNVFALDRAKFDFLDVQDGHKWSIDLGAKRGKLALLAWMFDANRRPPAAGPLALLKDVLALKASKGKTVAECLDIHAAHFRSFWEPLCIGILNANPQEAAAELLWAVFEETVLLGGHAAKPLLTKNGLGDALVEPALAVLKKSGTKVQFGQRVQAIEVQGGRVTSLKFSQGIQVVKPHDLVVLAVPHFVVGTLIEGLSPPENTHAILNVHYRLDEEHETGLKGLVGSPVQWVFTRGHIASVTMSAADDWISKDSAFIAKTLWPDVVRVLGLKTSDVPAFRVIKERRATFAQSPESLALRANPETALENLILAGDWTNTGLPATIEGAVRSGRKAAQAVLA
ncbi:MAG: FAD-dependent oxidoreductase, partial [Magnetovibrio sp.]|nr:FAD-dependent oxidoreductase [Magnetovibrio sp.]